MANLFFILSCLGLMVSIVYCDDSECAIPPRSQWKEESKCCQMPDLDIYLSARKECFNELKTAHPEFESKKNRPKWPQSSNVTRCFEECVFNKSSLLDGDKKIKSDAVHEEAKRIMTGDWEKVAANAVDDCLETAPRKVPEDAECKSGSFELGMCITRHLFMNCPTVKWTDSELCNVAKARLERCADLPPPIPFHHHRGHHHGHNRGHHEN